MTSPEKNLLYGRPPRPTLSAAIITLDAAATLPRTLARLDWVVDLVVVDSGSSDGTVELARRCGARVFTRGFDHFAAQRNFALAHALGDWVLFIDADEWPSAPLVREIRHTLRRTRHHGLRVPIRSNIFGRRFRFSGTQDDYPTRLVRRGYGQWRGQVHERLVCAGGRVGRLHHALYHETMPTRAAFLAKMRRYTALEAAARVQQRQAPRWFDAWWRAPREVARRLVYRHGWLDGPEGWAFCLLSGRSEWSLAQSHRRLWQSGAITPADNQAEFDTAPHRRAA